MPYDESVALRVRPILLRLAGFSERKMFGGVGYLLQGNMCCGVWKEFLILRVGPEAYHACLQEPGAKEFDITGRPMRGWVMIAPEGYRNQGDLVCWVQRAIRFASSLPAKGN